MEILKYLKGAFLIFIILVGEMVRADINSVNPFCPHINKYNPNVQRERNWLIGLWDAIPRGKILQAPDCHISVSGLGGGRIYRDYQFTRDGGFLVTESTPKLGQRVYFIFPRPKILSYRVEYDETHRVTGIEIQMKPYRKVEIAPDGRILGMTGAKITQDLRISESSRGGVTFDRAPGLVLDAGWGHGHKGDHDRADREGSARFINRSGRVCVVQNSEIFDYRYSGSYRPVIFKTDSMLADFLDKRCSKGFDEGALRNPTILADSNFPPPQGRAPGSAGTWK